MEICISPKWRNKAIEILRLHCYAVTMEWNWLQTEWNVVETWDKNWERGKKHPKHIGGIEYFVPWNQKHSMFFYNIIYIYSISLIIHYSSIVICLEIWMQTDNLHFSSAVVI